MLSSFLEPLQGELEDAIGGASDEGIVVRLEIDDQSGLEVVSLEHIGNHE